jgi:hypothetical protein
MLEAERRFRVIVGFSDLARLAVTVERELTRALPNRVASQEAAIVASRLTSHPDRHREVPRRPGYRLREVDPAMQPTRLVVLASGMGSRLRSKAEPEAAC